MSGRTWRRHAALAAAALTLACSSPSGNVSPAPPPCAIPDDAAPAPSTIATAAANSWAWQQYESPAAADAGLLARPLSPHRASLLADELKSRVWEAGRVTNGGRTIAVEDSFVIAQGDAQAPIDPVAHEVRRETQFLWRTAFTHRLYHAVKIFLFQHRSTYEAFRKLNGPPDSRPQDISFYSPDDYEAFVCMEGGGIGDARTSSTRPRCSIRR